MSFSDFKNKSQNSIEELTKQLASIENKKSYKDDRFWRPQLDKSSNGFAIIRFLPARTEDDAWATLPSWDINIVKIYINIISWIYSHTVHYYNFFIFTFFYCGNS